MLKRILWLLALIVVAAAVAVGVLYVRINEPYRGYEVAGQFVEIPQGSGSLTIGERLCPPA